MPQNGDRDRRGKIALQVSRLCPNGIQWQTRGMSKSEIRRQAQARGEQLPRFKTVELATRVVANPDGRGYVASCPALGISALGDTQGDAEAALDRRIAEHIEAAETASFRVPLVRG